MSSKRDRIQGLLNRTDSTEPSSAAKQELLLNVNTANQFTVITESQTTEKKKATYELDAQLHTRLKIFAARSGVKMVDVVEDALQQYLERNEQA